MLRKLIPLFLLAIASSAAYATTEIGQIIKNVLAEQKDGRLPWSFYAQPGSPIRWETEGVGEYKHEGKAVLSVNGFVPEVLGKNIEQGQWMVRAGGDKFGIRTLAFSNDSCFGSSAVSKNCFPRLEQFPQSLKAAGIESEVICKFGPGPARSEIRRIKLKEGVPLYLHSLVNEGSGGNILVLNIIFKGASKGSELEHSTAICAFLFASSYGADSNVAYDYRYLIGK